MKKIALLLIFFSPLYIKAQNLVNNPGFEEYTASPTQVNQLNLCKGWSNCNGYYGGQTCSSPDFISLLGSGQVGLPNDVLATLYPHSGKCAADFTTYDGGFVDYREYISTYFTSPLVVGETYTVSFYLTSGVNQLSDYNSNNIGVLFSMDSVHNCIKPINRNPQINITTVIDTPAWALYTFQFVADSAYRYITFGDFYSDAATTLVHTHNNGNPYAQNFIDDISVEIGCNDTNIVNNPGFEDYKAYPTDVNELNLCKGWSNCNGYYGGQTCSSPDYISLFGSGQVGLPNDVLATVYPHSGYFAADFSTYDGGFTDYREYIRTYFTSPMVIGQIYNVSFYLTSGANQLSDYNSNNIGVLFSMDSVTNCIKPINRKPQLNITEVNDTSDWKLYTFQYTADSAYRYITFGDFYSDSATTLVHTHNNGNPYAQNFIDDISVSKPCNNESGINVLPTFNAISVNVFPNPSTGIININSQKNIDVLKVTNLLRQLIYEANPRQTHFTFDIKNAGIYFLTITSDNQITTKKILVSR